jgi:hypothetical protein
LTWNSQLEDKCTVLKSEDERTLHKSVLCQKIKALYPSQKKNVHYPSQSEDKWTVSQSDDERKSTLGTVYSYSDFGRVHSSSVFGTVFVHWLRELSVRLLTLIPYARILIWILCFYLLTDLGNLRSSSDWDTVHLSNKKIKWKPTRSSKKILNLKFNIDWHETVS